MRGTAKHTRQQIQDELDRLKARVDDRRRRRRRRRVSIETTRDELPGGAARSWPRSCASPSFPANEFEQLRAGEPRRPSSSSAASPTRSRATRYQRHMNPYPKGDVALHADARRVDRRGYKAATLERREDVLRGVLRRVDTRELAVVGDFDAAAVAALVARALRRLEEPAAVHARAAARTRRSPPINQTLETPDKANAFFIAGLNLEPARRRSRTTRRWCWATTCSAAGS